MEEKIFYLVIKVEQFNQIYLLQIPAINLEHFGIEKYEVLRMFFDVNIATCKHHNSFNSLCHCSLYKVLLFAAKICDKKRKNIIYI